MKNYKEFLNSDPSVLQLKDYCRQNNIKGFSLLRKKEIRDLIERMGKSMDTKNVKSLIYDTENDVFFENAANRLKIKLPAKKEYPKTNRKEMELFLKDADAMEKKTRMPSRR